MDILGLLLGRRRVIVAPQRIKTVVKSVEEADEAQLRRDTARMYLQRRGIDEVRPLYGSPGGVR